MNYILVISMVYKRSLQLGKWRTFRSLRKYILFGANNKMDKVV